MRRLFLLLSFCCLFNQSKSQSSSFTKNLEAAVVLLNKCQTRDQYVIAFAKMEELHKQDPSAWLPTYYASIIKARMAMKKMGDSDQLANEAIQWLTITKALHNSDEVLCLESIVYTSKMAVNHIFRWKVYESRIKKPLEQAIALNKNNPRPYILKANLQYKMPVFFGGGCNSARPIAQKAKLAFDQVKTDFTVMPHWGRPILDDLIKACPL
jgi:hypothetical protein